MLLDLQLAQRRGMHKRWAANPVVQCRPVKEAGAEFPHRAAEEIDVFAELDLRVEASDTLDAIPTDEGGAADKQGVVEDHSCCEAETRAEAATDRGAARRAAEENALAAHLCLGRVAKWLDVTKDNAHAAMGVESCNRVRVVTLRYKIVVVEEVYEPAAGKGPAKIAHHAREAAGRLRIPEVADRSAEFTCCSCRRALGAVVDNDQLNLDPGLRAHARDRFFKQGRPTKRRNNDGNVYWHGSVAPTRRGAHPKERNRPIVRPRRPKNLAQITK